MGDSTIGGANWKKNRKSLFQGNGGKKVCRRPFINIPRMRRVNCPIRIRPRFREPVGRKASPRSVFGHARTIGHFASIHFPLQGIYKYLISFAGWYRSNPLSPTVLPLRINRGKSPVDFALRPPSTLSIFHPRRVPESSLVFHVEDFVNWPMMPV